MSKLKVTTIANVADSESTDVTNVINGSAKAWVNFNGTGTVAIRQGFNVSSITDNGTGDYTVNFTTAMPDVNYSFVGTSTVDPTNTARQLGVFIADHVTTPTSSAIRIQTRSTSNATPIDPNWVYSAIFR